MHLRCMAVLCLKTVVPNDNHPEDKVRLFMTTTPILSNDPTQEHGIFTKICRLQQDKTFDNVCLPLFFPRFCDTIIEAKEEGDKLRKVYPNDVTTDPSGFVLLSDYVPHIIQEIRYFSTYNFIGERLTAMRNPTR